MSDFARLQKMLSKLGQRERAPGEGRKLRGSSAQGFLSSLISEIDETILPRRLVFLIDNKVAVHLAVANRRMQAMLSPAPDVQANISKELLDHAFVGADDPMIIVIGSILEAAFEDAKLVMVTAHRQTKLNFDPDVGAEATRLAGIWSVVEEEDVLTDPAEQLSTFLEGLGDDVIAWLRIEGENVIEQGGDDEAVTSLGEHAAYFLDGYFGKFDALFPPAADSCATLISPKLPNGPAAFFIEAGTSSAFIAVPTEGVLKLATRWQALVAD